MASVVRHAFVAVAAVLAVGPGEASCVIPYNITSINGPMVSYVETPGVPAGSGYQGSTISEMLDGAFWAVGYGDSAIGAGVDNGTFAPIGGDPAWIYVYANYPAVIATTWATAIGQTDFPCPDVMGPIGERCTAILLADVDPVAEQPAFALLAAHDDPFTSDFSFAQPGGAPIALAPLPAPRVVHTTGEVEGEAFEIQVRLRGPDTASILQGTYLSDRPWCFGPGAAGDDPFNGMVLGYRLYRQVLPRGSPSPMDYARSAWADTLLPVVPVDEPVVAEASCTADSDVYFAYSLVVDSGFETSVVSKESLRIECGPNRAEPPPRRRFRPTGRALDGRRANAPLTLD